MITNFKSLQLLNTCLFYYNKRSAHKYLIQYSNNIDSVAINITFKFKCIVFGYTK